MTTYEINYYTGDDDFEDASELFDTMGAALAEAKEAVMSSGYDKAVIIQRTELKKVVRKTRLFVEEV